MRYTKKCSAKAGNKVTSLPFDQKKYEERHPDKKVRNKLKFMICLKDFLIFCRISLYRSNNGGMSHDKIGSWQKRKWQNQKTG